MPKLLIQPEGAEHPVPVEIARHSDPTRVRFEATIDDRRIEFERLGGSATDGVFSLHGRVVRFFASQRGRDLTVWLNGRTYRFQRVDRVARRAGGAEASAASSTRIIAPMPGTILKINAAVGASFSAKDPLIVMESMKMEMSLTSAAPGRVLELHCRIGEMVDRGALLATLELEAESS